MPSWVRYSLIRFGLFAVVFAGLLLLQLNPIVAALIAAVAGFCLAYIFFRPQRDAVVAEFTARRTAEKALPASDEAAEDPEDAETAPESETPVTEAPEGTTPEGITPERTTPDATAPETSERDRG
ncbi:MAG: DUF4229 domain-containing protein [Microbacteriaceae bacterium]